MKRTIILIGAVLFSTVACKQADKKIEKTDTQKSLLTLAKEPDFNTTINGKNVGLYVLKNGNGIEATFTNFGQRLISLFTPDKNGDFEDIVLGFYTLRQYQEADEKYFGATIGRYGNRIAKGKFSLGDQEFTLSTNNGENHLHGGDVGFESVVWDVDTQSDNTITFSRTSIDGEEGYPGNLKVSVKYELTDYNELIINYKARTNKKTIVNLTHHSFFNLKGQGNGTINEHVLMLNAAHYTPVDGGLIPTGEIAQVAETPFDFTIAKPIGRDLEIPHQQLEFGLGYDHNFVLNQSPVNEDGLVLAAKVFEPGSGRTMEVFTNEPGIQFYGGNFLKGNKGKEGKSYDFRGAFCLETQHFPNSPNQPNFPSTILEPGQTYTSTCVYKFSAE
ncbi:MAG: aldose epimerase family protein [Bacteroidota bacterium]